MFYYEKCGIYNSTLRFVNMCSDEQQDIGISGLLSILKYNK